MISSDIQKNIAQEITKILQKNLSYTELSTQKVNYLTKKPITFHGNTSHFPLIIRYKCEH